MSEHLRVTRADDAVAVVCTRCERSYAVPDDLPPAAVLAAVAADHPVVGEHHDRPPRWSQEAGPPNG